MLSFIFLLQTTLVYSQWYEEDSTKSVTFTSDATNDISKAISARSSIECVLKCRVKCMKSYFVETKHQCFCLKNEEQELYSKDEENLDGEMFKKHEGLDCEDKVRIS